jgi:hypothetical protein
VGGAGGTGEGAVGAAPHAQARQEPPADAAADEAPPAADGLVANRSRLFADSPAPAADAAAAPAHGWQELCDLEGAGGAGDAAASEPEADAAAPAAEGSGASEGLPLDADGNMPFYLLDAYENPDRPGGPPLSLFFFAPQARAPHCVTRACWFSYGGWEGRRASASTANWDRRPPLQPPTKPSGR